MWAFYVYNSTPKIIPVSTTVLYANSMVAFYRPLYITTFTWDFKPIPIDLAPIDGSKSDNYNGSYE